MRCRRPIRRSSSSSRFRNCRCFLNAAVASWRFARLASCLCRRGSASSIRSRPCRPIASLLRPLLRRPHRHCSSAMSPRRRRPARTWAHLTSRTIRARRATAPTTRQATVRDDFNFSGSASASATYLSAQTMRIDIVFFSLSFTPVNCTCASLARVPLFSTPASLAFGQPRVTGYALRTALFLSLAFASKYLFPFGSFSHTLQTPRSLLIKL